MSKVPSADWVWILASAVLHLLAFLALMALASVVYPAFGSAVVSFVTSPGHALGIWLGNLGWPHFALAAFVGGLIILFSQMRFGASWLAKNSVLALAKKLQRRFAPSPPARTLPLANLKLRQAQWSHTPTDGETPLYGREADLQWLKDRCIETSRGLKIIALWGPQGIGKTLLAYSFARDLSAGTYPSCGTWSAHLLDREFVPAALTSGLPNSPTLLLWDDPNLSDDAGKKRLGELQAACSSRRHPVVILLTAWQSREGDGPTPESKLLDAEREVKPLEPQFAKEIYPDAAQLDPQMCGHPLYLRLISDDEAGASALTGQPRKSLWELCTSWATGHLARLKTEHQLSANAIAALAIVSSSGTAAISALQVPSACSLKPDDIAALKRTGRVIDKQGALWLLPVGPDLMGWAFAIVALQNDSTNQFATWAKVAWQFNFFDTGRFLQHKTTVGIRQHAWLQALHGPTFTVADSVAALNRAKAASNAVNQYGKAKMWPEMAAELQVAAAIARQATAETFSNDEEVQLARAQAAFNAVSDYGKAEKWSEMAQELRAATAIAVRAKEEKFSDDAEIQLVRAMAAFNAVTHYGNAKKWPEMAAELQVAAAIAARAIAEAFSIDADLQHVRLMAATNAVSDYGKAQMWPEIVAELQASVVIAQRFPGNQEIQLKFAKSLLNQVVALDEVQHDPASALQALVTHLTAHRYLTEAAPFEQIWQQGSAFLEEMKNAGVDGKN